MAQNKSNSPNIAARLVLGFLHGWRLLISPIYGQPCRYLPTCSDYAVDAIRIHGAARGSFLTAKRLCRCHPWGGSGYDPVPDHDCSKKNPPTERAPHL